MNFDFGDVLTRAWQITWKHKMLWVFNMFPVLITFLFLPVVFIPMFFLGPNSLISQDFISGSSYTSLFIVTDIILTVLSLVLYASGSASVSLGILRAESGKQALLFKELFQDGLKYFWRILGLTLLIGGIVLVTVLLLFGCTMLIGMATMGLGMICLQPLLVSIYPALLIIYGLTEESQAALIAENISIVDAISRAWLLLKENFWTFILISILLYFGILILSSIVTLPLFAPFFFLPMAMEKSRINFDVYSLGWVLMLSSLIFLPILAIVQGAALTFMKSTYMIVYLQLTRPVVLQPTMLEPTA